MAMIEEQAATEKHVEPVANCRFWDAGPKIITVKIPGDDLAGQPTSGTWTTYRDRIRT